MQDTPQCMLEEPQAQLVTDCRLNPTVALFLVVGQCDNRTTDALEYTTFDFVKDIDIFLVLLGIWISGFP